MTIEEGESVSEILRVFKSAVTTLAAEMVGYRTLRGQKRELHSG